MLIGFAFRALLGMSPKQYVPLLFLTVLTIPVLYGFQMIPSCIAPLLGRSVDVCELSIVCAVIAFYAYFIVRSRYAGVPYARIFQLHLFSAAVSALLVPHRIIREQREVKKGDYIYIVPLIFMGGLIYYVIQGWCALGVHIFNYPWWFSRIFSHAFQFIAAWLLGTMGLWMLAKLYHTSVSMRKLEAASLYLITIVWLSPFFDLGHGFGVHPFSFPFLGIRITAHLSWFATYIFVVLQLFFIFRDLLCVRRERLFTALLLCLFIPPVARLLLLETPTYVNTFLGNMPYSFWHNSWPLLIIFIVMLNTIRLACGGVRISATVPVVAFIGVFAVGIIFIPHVLHLIAATSSSGDMESGTITYNATDGTTRSGTVTYTIPAATTSFYSDYKATINSITAQVGFTANTNDWLIVDGNPYSYTTYLPGGGGSYQGSTWANLNGASTQTYVWNSSHGSWSTIVANTQSSGNQLSVYGRAQGNGLGGTFGLGDVLEYNSVTVTYDYDVCTLTQNYFRFYENINNITPTDALAGENLTPTGVANSDLIRLRMTVQAGSSPLRAGQQFKLQYATTETPQAPATVWNDVGASGSGSIWRFYNNGGVADGTTVPSTLISVADTAATYEESNNSAGTPNQINAGDDGEWDWVLENNGAADATVYSFRMLEDDSTVLTYTRYPQLETTDVGEFIWDDGGAADSNWTTDENWNNDAGYPDGTDDWAVFNNTSDEDCTADEALTIRSIDIANTYDGTVTLGANLSVSEDLSIGANCTIDVASYELRVGGNLTLHAANEVLLTGSTGAVIFDSDDHDNTISGGNINIDTTFMVDSGDKATWTLLNDLSISGDLSIGDDCTLSLGSYDLTVSGDSTIYGNVIMDAGATIFIGDTKTLDFKNGSDLNISGTSATGCRLQASEGGFSNVSISGSLTANYVTIENLTGSGVGIGSTADINGFANATFDNFADRVNGAYITVQIQALTTSGTLTSSGCAFNNSNSACDYNVKTLPAGDGALNYWRFIDETGDLVGEDYDNDDGDPGSIHWTPQLLIGAIMIVSSAKKYGDFDRDTPLHHLPSLGKLLRQAQDGERSRTTSEGEFLRSFSEEERGGALGGTDIYRRRRSIRGNYLAD